MVIKPYNKIGVSKTAEIASMFDNIAAKYDFLNHSLSIGIDKLWRKGVVKIMQRVEPRTILDVACGTADISIAVAKKNFNQVIGVDISKEMLAIGEKKVKALNLDDTIKLVYGDSEDLKFEDGSFDAVTVGFGVRNFENLEIGLSEMCRVLKRGGILVILEFSKTSAFPIKQLFYLYFNIILPFIGRIISRDTRAYKYLPISVNNFPHGSEFCEILKTIGFDDIRIKKLTFGIASLYEATKK